MHFYEGIDDFWTVLATFDLFSFLSAFQKGCVGFRLEAEPFPLFVHFVCGFLRNGERRNKHFFPRQPYFIGCFILFYTPAPSKTGFTVGSKRTKESPPLTLISRMALPTSHREKIRLWNSMNALNRALPPPKTQIKQEEKLIRALIRMISGQQEEPYFRETVLPYARRDRLPKTANNSTALAVVFLDTSVAALIC